MVTKARPQTPSKDSKGDPATPNKPTPTGRIKTKDGSSRKSPAFGGTAKRDARFELMGEGSPGPGSYLPASTFARAASPSRSKSAKGRPQSSSSFRSGSAQRPRALNEHVPGAGAYTPSRTAIEPGARNPGSALASKGNRFGDRTCNISASETEHIGPGEYESQNHRSVKETITKSIKANSRANPGFGRGSSRKLPHEEALESDLKPFKNLSPEQKRKMDEQDKYIADLASRRTTENPSNNSHSRMQSAQASA